MVFRPNWGTKLLQSTKVYTVLYILEIPEHINNYLLECARSDPTDPISRSLRSSPRSACSDLPDPISTPSDPHGRLPVRPWRGAGQQLVSARACARRRGSMPEGGARAGCVAAASGARAPPRTLCCAGWDGRDGASVAAPRGRGGRCGARLLTSKRAAQSESCTGWQRRRC